MDEEYRGSELEAAHRLNAELEEALRDVIYAADMLWMAYSGKAVRNLDERMEAVSRARKMLLQKTETK